MDEVLRQQVAAAFHKILLIRRISWLHTKTADPDHPNNFFAVRNIFGQQRFRPIRRIVIYGLTNPGTVTELIVVAREIGSVLQENFGGKVTVCAYNPEFSQETIEGLTHSKINVIDDLDQINHDRSLIYDVSKQQGQLLDSLGLASTEGKQESAPPAAIIVDWKDILQSGSTELTSDLLRVYHMVSLVDFESRVAPTRDEERLVFRERNKALRCQKESELREWETQATQWEYTKATTEHNRDLNAHEQRVEELARSIRARGEHNGEQEIKGEARRELLAEAPLRMRSYVNDPMMVLLVRKGI